MTAQLHFNFASQKGLRTLDSLSHAPEQQVFRGCLYIQLYYQATAPQERLAVRMKGAPCRPPASYVSAANSALDLDLLSIRPTQTGQPPRAFCAGAAVPDPPYADHRKAPVLRKRLLLPYVPAALFF